MSLRCQTLRHLSQFGQNFHFVHGLLFSRNFWMEFERMSLHIRKSDKKS